jgi:methylated-DNA-[protein]-cysteine S-methyltransferase
MKRRPKMPVAYRETTIGVIGISEDSGAVTGLFFENATVPLELARGETPLLLEAFAQLGEYLAGARRDFDLPLMPRGTAWQTKCWAALREIPYGETIAYGELARRVGNPKACRAVGMANNRNPLPIFIPCHRVIGADGSLTGYAGGLDIKERLLRLENSSDDILGRPRHG